MHPVRELYDRTRTSKSQQKKKTASIVLKFYRKKKRLPPCRGWVARPFPSFLKPLFQSKAKCKASDTKISFYSDEDGTYYHIIIPR